MGYSFSQPSISSSLPTIESAPFFGKRLKRLDTSLLIETTVVMTVSILAIRVFVESSVSRAAWFVVPGILVAAALIPTVIKGSKFPKIGLNIKQIGLTLAVVCRTCIVVFPALFAGFWLLKSCGLELPLRAMLPQGQSWVCLMFYQFMYIAVAEEVFYRGYVQSNILTLAKAVMGRQCRLQQWISIGISAACFAVAHIVVHGQIISALTFLPGLIFGWLFIRTRSLLAPILFHGLANGYYFFVVALFA